MIFLTGAVFVLLAFITDYIGQKIFQYGKKCERVVDVSYFIFGFGIGLMVVSLVITLARVMV